MRGRAATRSRSATRRGSFALDAAPSRSGRRSAVPRPPGTPTGRRRCSRVPTSQRPAALAGCAPAPARASRGTSAAAPSRTTARAASPRASGPRSTGSPAIGWCVSCASSTRSAMVSWICCASARSAVVVGHEPEPRREEGEDVRGLRHDDAADLHEGRRERQRAGRLAVEEAHHRREAAARLGQPRHVDVARAGVLERQADELAAALDERPVVELDACGRLASPLTLPGRHSGPHRDLLRPAPPLTQHPSRTPLAPIAESPWLL